MGPPLAPLDDWGMSHNGPNPRSFGEEAHKTFYGSLFALALSTIRFGKMSCGIAQGRENFPAIDNLESEWLRGGFATTDLLSAFATPGGSEIDLTMSLSPEFDHKSEL